MTADDDPDPVDRARGVDMATQAACGLKDVKWVDVTDGTGVHITQVQVTS